MLELTTGTIWAIELFVEAFAELSLIVFGYVWLRIQFMHTMSKGAVVFELASASQFPVLAKLGLIFGAESFHLGACLASLIG